MIIWPGAAHEWFDLGVGLLLFVCEGNICRSPFAERVLQSMLVKPPPNLIITSAGTAPAYGNAIAGETAKIIELLGARSGAHQPKEATRQLLDDAELVLTATRDQRAKVVQRHPPAILYTFTIRQLGHILGAPVADESAVHLDGPVSIAEFARARVASAAGIGDDADVVDPFRQASSTHAMAALQMLPTLNLLATTLGGTALEIPPRLLESARPPRRWRGLRTRGR